MDTRQGKQIMSEKVFTVPNMLSLLRILLIPVIIYLYGEKKAYYAAAGVVVLSGLTDVVDGYIARHFQMVTNLGKILDPIADKLTQGATLICLVSRFQHLLILVIVLAVKEIGNGIISLITVHKTQAVKGADVYGKVTSAMIFVAMMAHLVWAGIPMWLSLGLTWLCIGMLILSFIHYTLRNISQIKSARS